MAVPLLDLAGQNAALEAEYMEAFRRVLGHGRFILGDEVACFEDAMAADLGVRHAVGASSGTDALIMALMAAGIGPGDEVLCPTFTFFATAGSITRVGATPVFVDSRYEDFNLDPALIEAALTECTRAIMPVPLFGQAADMAPLLELARKHDLVVIEDAAQSLGARLDDRPAGTFGDMGCYSFFPSKNLGGFGDGGLLVTNDEALAERARAARNHGMAPKYVHQFVGGNFRLDALQAALLNVKRPHLPAYAEARRANATAYNEAFAGLDGVIPPRELAGRHHVWNQYTLRFTGEGERDRVRTALQAASIGCEVYYPVPMHQQPCFAELGHGAPGTFPVADALATQVLSLPVYPELTPAQRDEVIARLREALVAA